MNGVFLLLGLTMLAGTGARAQSPAFTPRDERMEDLPTGPGREETFGLCTACHGFRLVSNQGSPARSGTRRSPG